uniref:PH domain-containing protein n=1 Tax=uncultured Polaribacter sp. TaxID=174711 RepID=UPI00260533CB|nr:PH domain-containing protein [uncultured Polaribacter sp.]
MTNFSEFSKQSPKGIIVLYFKQIYTTLKLFWILLFFAIKDFSKFSKIGENYIYLGILVVLLFFLIRAFLIYKNFLFKINNNHFILQQGIISKTNTSIPFHRIQNINFKQNLVQQIINVYEVSIETAGSTDTEIAIKALNFEDANNLKSVILDSKEINESVVKQSTEKPFLKISILELFKVSLTENHLRNLFLFFAILLGFFQQIQQIADSFGETETLDGFIIDSTNAVSTSFILVFTLLVFLTITAFITSFVRIFLVHFNLSAYLKKDAFEINQGLFTKKSIILKKQKIQNITVSTNPLKRLIGISNITFKQAVSGKINQKNEKVIKIVGCKKNQVDDVKTNLYDFKDIEAQVKMYPDTYYKKRVYFFNLLFLVIIYVSIYIFTKPFFLYSLVLILPIYGFLIQKKIKKRFYKLNDEMIVVGNGMIETHHTYLELFKVQNIKLKQTIFQQRSNVTDLILQTASGKITVPCLSYSKAIEMYNHILYKVETSRKSWM